MDTLLVVLASFSQASVEFIRRILPSGTNALLVATFISLSGGILGLIAATAQNKWHEFSKSALGFSVLAGVAVLLLDIFLVTAYSRGLKLSVGVPLFVGATVFFGFFYSLISGDKISWISAFGSGLVVLGSILIATQNS
ncbi:MAG: hypothetical protein COU11_03615 [Candidatus Harrisonbacteria bacterium CG10_big_fil_rev_8_21_14_0_10_49_15]|uniref:EamA domain-containing protein n=1 Tax=Candidatus Harrisonbacteria bacterium CG10_big_fil_rev_8_21_14_0_10_49_15 TaxID=1974587 RepID=A0A2H0UMB9_9BACT|nr:MAG: hypothetical protein COU11_03615 [Candidatus Harrisonbacteria bacterium CG10_big_fil_rev_8_21_14_0_10_49_15]